MASSVATASTVLKGEEDVGVTSSSSVGLNDVTRPSAFGSFLVSDLMRGSAQDTYKIPLLGSTGSGGPSSV
jgi:hypothetical protein